MQTPLFYSLQKEPDLQPRDVIGSTDFIKAAHNT